VVKLGVSVGERDWEGEPDAEGVAQKEPVPVALLLCVRAALPVAGAVPAPLCVAVPLAVCVFAETVVEAKIKTIIGDAPIVSLLDLGTGTGRMVSLLGAQAQRIVGVDASHAMLAVARANLELESMKGVEWRQGDLYALPVDRNAFELVMIHQVLHFLDDPARALREAAQALAPGGRLVVIDFAPHDLEFLRETQAHRRLGFSVGQMSDWLIEAGLEVTEHDDIAPPNTTGGQLTVSIFVARDPRRKMT
jgi:ArsR family transcriptional regulator